MQSLQRWGYQFYQAIIVLPLRKLYFGGPTLFNYGFWGGRHASDICAEITNVRAEFWSENTDDCQALLDQRFASFLIAIEIGLYAYLLYQVARVLGRALLWKLRLTPESWHPPPWSLVDLQPRVVHRVRLHSPQAQRRASP